MEQTSIINLIRRSIKGDKEGKERVVRRKVGMMTDKMGRIWARASL